MHQGVGASLFCWRSWKDSNLRAISHRRFSGPLPSTTRPHEHMAQRAGFEPTSRGLADDGLAIRCPTVRRPLQICTLFGCVGDPWQTRTADSSLRGWRLRPTCRRGHMVCRAGFEPANRNGTVLQTACFNLLHTDTYGAPGWNRTSDT